MPDTTLNHNWAKDTGGRYGIGPVDTNGFGRAFHGVDGGSNDDGTRQDVGVVIYGPDGTPISTNSANALAVASGARRNGGVLHRSGVTAVDKLALAGAPTSATDQATGGSLSFNTTYNMAYIAGNRWGVAGQTTPPTVSKATANDSNNTHTIRAALAQIAGADYYDVFLSTAAAPLWVGRITETQRATAGCRITAVGTVDNAGAGAAGTVEVFVVGTGIATTVPSFNAAFTPAAAGITPIDCTGFTSALIQVKVSMVDFRLMPASIVLATFAQQSLSTNDWIQIAGQTLVLATGGNSPLEQQLPAVASVVNGAAAFVVLVSTIPLGNLQQIDIWVDLV